MASILLIAPTVIHRLEFQRGRKAYIVHVSNRLALAGLTTFAVAMTSAITLITHYLLGPATAIVTAAGALCAFALTWFVMPLRHRIRRG